MRHALTACALAGALATSAAAPVHAAGEGAGTAAASFLSIGSGASVLSMGGATLASGSDLASAAWNPATLARLQALELALAHAPLPGGGTQDWLAAGGPLLGFGSRWSVQTIVQREGGIEGRDAANNPTSELSATDLAFAGHLAQRVGVVEAGLGLEWVHESLAGVTGSGVACALGLRSELGPLGLGLAARHLGGGMRYGAARYDMPGVIAAGVSWTDGMRGLRLAADFERPDHYYPSLRVGGEWRWRELLAIRGGYRHDLGAPAEEQLSGPTFGLGTGMGAWWLDYGFTPGGNEATGAHRLGLTFRPGSGNGRQVLGSAPSPRPSAPAPPRATVPASKPQVKATAPATVKPAAGVPAASSPRPSAPPKVTPPPASAPAPQAAPPNVAPLPASPPAPQAAPPPARPYSVVVAEGETMAQIASRWGTTVPALMMTNNLVSEHVKPGQVLKLPPPARR